MTRKSVAVALFVLSTSLSVYPIRAGAAESSPVSDEFCKTMMDNAAQIWPLDQVQQCAPWRKQHLQQLQKAALDCQAAHKGDLDHLDACDVVNDAADRFWEESEYVENNRDVPPEKANPVIHH
jgi:hypothetical protein